MLFVCYPKCSTCRDAQRWLEEHGLRYTVRDMKSDRPTVDELRAWISLSKLPLKRFFNTSGLSYRALSLKEKLPAMPEEDQLLLLASDGMLVKRPILVCDGFVLIGFQPEIWTKALLC